jgi:hypothetical protein
MATDREICAETICGLMDYYGPRQLALILNVTVDDLCRWSSGKSRPPTDVFFRVINLSKAVSGGAEGLVAAEAAHPILLAVTAMEDEDPLRRAFCKHRDGSWTCIAPATLYTPGGRIHVTPRSRFYPGTTFMGCNLVNWLKARLDDTVECRD